LFVSIAMALVRRRHLYNMRTGSVPVVPSNVQH
jgi:hypothetical protein